MRHVTQRATVGTPAREAYERLADFSRYPDLAPSVLRVHVEDMAPDDLGRARCRSSWEVTFRSGVLRWVEVDVFQPAAGRIDFAQESGDIELFVGSWHVLPEGTGAAIEFSADFDLGLPGLDTFLEPVAQRALEDNVREILLRLFPAAELMTEAEILQ